jgi:hypothetical protein
LRRFTEAVHANMFSLVLTHRHTDLSELLTESRATESFKNDVMRFLETGEATRVQISGYAPRVKVTRLLKHVLASHPDLDIHEVSVRGQSGCSDFVGTVELATATDRRTFQFVWCCRWRAEEEGWLDYFGFPDQMRAAREFDWRCFKVWQEQ